MGCATSRGSVASNRHGGGPPAPAKQHTELLHASSTTTNGETPSLQVQLFKRSDELGNGAGAVTPDKTLPVNTKAVEGAIHGTGPSFSPTAANAVKEENASNGRVLSTPTLGKSNVESLELQSPTAQHHNTRGQDRSNTEAGTENNANAVNLLSSQASDAVRSRSKDVAGSAHPRSDSYSLWANDREGSQGPYPIYIQAEKTQHQALTNEVATPAHYNMEVAQLKGAGCRLEHQQHPSQRTVYSSTTGGKRSSATEHPHSSVAWRAPPAPPAPPPSFPRCYQTPQEQKPVAASVPVSNSGVVPEAAIEVVARPPPPFSAATSRSVESARRAPGANQRSRAGSEKYKNGQRTSQEPPVTAEQRLPNLRSILGASPGPSECESASPFAPKRYPADSQFDECASAAQRSSAPLSVTSSLWMTNEPAPRGVSAAREDSSASSTLLGGSCTSNIVDAFPVHSAFQLIPESNNTQDKVRLYGSFMYEYAAATQAPASAAAASNAHTPSAMPAMESKPTAMQGKRSVHPHSPPNDSNYFSMCTVERSKNELKPQDVRKRSEKTSAESGLAHSLPKASLPPEDETEEPQHRSPMDSPMEVFFPYAHSLRPRQWQYASVLRRKIEEKAREKKAGEQAKQLQLLLQEKPSNVSRRASEAVSRPSSTATKSKQLPQFAMLSTATEKIPGSVTPGLDKWQEEQEGDLFTSSYFVNNTSIVIPPSTRGNSVSMQKPMTHALEKARPEELSPTAIPAPEGLQVAESKDDKTRKEKDEALKPATAADGPPTAPAKETSNDRVGGELEERALIRSSSLLSVNSVFTDNGYPLLHAHLSDFYKENMSLNGTSSVASMSSIMEVSRDRMEPISTMADGRLAYQGIGYADKQAPSPATLDSHPPSARRDQQPQIEGLTDKVTSLKAVGDRLTPRSCRWGIPIPNSPVMRHQLLREQQRRLLREQQLYVRQLRNNDQRPTLVPPQHQQLAQPLPMVLPFSSNSPHLDNARTQSAYGDTDSAQTPGQQQPQHVQPPLPMPPSRRALAIAFFTEANPQLNVAHCGGTGQARPQPDIKYGPYVATDKSRNIDFKKVLGFSLEDVPTTASPNWVALLPPGPNEDSTKL